MAAKVTPAVLDRMRELKSKYNLNNPVIAERLGLSIRTVRAYLNGQAKIDEDRRLDQAFKDLVTFEPEPDLDWDKDHDPCVQLKWPAHR